MGFKEWSAMHVHLNGQKSSRWVHEDQCQHPRHGRTRERSLQNPKDVS
jgi:hypothetical protein